MDQEDLRELRRQQTIEARRLAGLLAQHIRVMEADGAELYPCVDGQYYKVAIDEVDSPPLPPGPSA